MLLVLLLACSSESTPTPAEATGASTPAPAVAVATPAPAPAANLPRVPATAAHRVAASHILVSYAGAVNALPNITRSKEEARARAEEALKRVQGGADFGETAKAYSDDSTGARGGSLGGFDDGTMVKPFEDAVKTLAVGQVSDLVETPFGFHIIRRDPLVEIHAEHLMVTWKGADSAPATVSRTKEEAKARVDEAITKLQGGAKWDDIVRAYSDGPLKEDGGDLGWFGRGQLAPALDSAAFDLDIGATSGVVESPRGFHVLHREE